MEIENLRLHQVGRFCRLEKKAKINSNVNVVMCKIRLKIMVGLHNFFFVRHANKVVQKQYEINMESNGTADEFCH